MKLLTAGKKVSGHFAARAVALLAIALIVAFFGWYRGSVSRPSFVEPYTLVADKISQSAAILIKLPQGVSVAQAAGHVAFEPTIEGSWVATAPDSATLLFKPNAPLAIGH